MSDTFQSHTWNQAHAEAQRKSANKKKNQNKMKAMIKTKKLEHHWHNNMKTQCAIVVEGKTLCVRMSNERQNITRKLGNQERNTDGAESK